MVPFFFFLQGPSDILIGGRITCRLELTVRSCAEVTGKLRQITGKLRQITGKLRCCLDQGNSYRQNKICVLQLYVLYLNISNH